MSDQIDRFVDDLRNSFDLVTDIDVRCDDILICGMGGSAVSGNIALDLCFDLSKVKVGVQRYPQLPEWVDGNTLAIICSYSGNTWETAAMYQAAVERDCQIVVISSGRGISETAKERGDKLISLPDNVQPRQTVGLMTGYICKIIDSVAGTDLEGRISKSLVGLRKYNCHLRVDEDNVAKRLAEYLHGKVPVIFSDSSMSSVSFRWKTQISENSKMVAFNCIFPEFNHNELVGWAVSSNNVLAPILISPSIQLDSVKNVTDACIHTLKSHGVNIYEVEIPGETRSECILKGVILGDYVSYYLALKNGVNPIEVLPIKMLKAEINDRRNDGIKQLPKYVFVPVKN